MLKVAFIGKANVGKSRLFNRLTASRQALVANTPGVTRDRQYAHGSKQLEAIIFIDTAGWSSAAGNLAAAMRQQSQAALSEADLILFVVDASQPPSSEDIDCAQSVRASGKACWLLLNKSDRSHTSSSGDYSRLGWPGMQLSALRGIGLDQLRARLRAYVRSQADTIPQPAPETNTLAQLRDSGEDFAGIKVVLVGRPNSGKSTLSNHLLGTARQIVSPEAGTTRDSVCNQMHYGANSIVLIDTPGLRRPATVADELEKLSSGKTREALELADVIICLIDATEGLTKQDLRILNQGWERGCALLLVVNKCDLLSPRQRENLQRQIDFRLRFISEQQIYWLSALSGRGVKRLLRSLPEAFAAVKSKFSTHQLCELLAAAIQARSPATVGGKKIKLRFAHMGSDRPPSIIIHGSNTELLSSSYQAYLSRYFARHLQVDLPRVKLEFRTKANPYN